MSSHLKVVGPDGEMLDPGDSKPPLHSGGDGSNSDGMNDRISRLEGQHDGIKHSQAMMLGVIGAVSAIMIGGFAIVITLQVGFRSEMLNAITGVEQSVDGVRSEGALEIRGTNQRIDALGDVLRTEFNAMRAEMAAQTSAIANSITATKQQVPQVILVPQPKAPE